MMKLTKGMYNLSFKRRKRLKIEREEQKRWTDGDRANDRLREKDVNQGEAVRGIEKYWTSQRTRYIDRQTDR